MKKILLLLFIAMFIFSCEDTFEELNTNQNVPTDGTPGNLLSGVIFNTADAHNTFNGSVIEEMMQFRFNIDAGAGGQFDFREGIWGSPFAVFSNISDIRDKAEEDPSLLAYAIAGRILRAYNAAILTDMYIDVPFSEAGKGFQNVITPKYDGQEDIFNSILQELREANSLINDDLALAQGGDLIYNGDITKWQKLANSLRLRYLLRISNVVDVSAEMQEIMDNPTIYPIFESNDDNAILDYTGEIPLLGVYDNLNRSQFEIRAPSKYYVDLMAPSMDPRLDFFYNLPQNPAINTYQGVPAGLSGTDFGTQFPQGGFDISLLSEKFFDVKGQIDYAFMTYSELNFILAEASLKGFVSGDAESYYKNGIESSLAYWGLSVEDDFYSQPNVIWDNTMETLMNQKWAASFLVFHFEIWGDYKRTGLPDFNQPVLTFPSTDGEIPTRMIYPITEQSLNAENYNNASQRIGGDNSISRHWYQGN